MSARLRWRRSKYQRDKRQREIFLWAFSRLVEYKETTEGFKKKNEKTEKIVLKTSGKGQKGRTSATAR